jgi:hypothetical protein
VNGSVDALLPLPVTATPVTVPGALDDVCVDVLVLLCVDVLVLLCVDVLVLLCVGVLVVVCVVGIFR